MHKLIKTGDGSHSLYVEELNEHYHSIHGALQESKHVFIEAGFKPTTSIWTCGKKNREISILEIGLGTGLNVLLTMIENQMEKLPVFYTAVEAYPVATDLLNLLNYPDLLMDSHNNKNNLQLFFNAIHSCGWNTTVEITDKFKLNKVNDTLQQVQLEEKYNLVYYDAFGPTAQPEMWTEDIFLKLWNLMENQGLLVTYCAKGSVKRLIKKIGFELETLKGPPGKREMIRAKKQL